MSQPKTKFELSYTISGHKADVRAICTTSSGNLITASRDCTAKLWECDQTRRSFEYGLTYEDHRNFVCSVCVVTDESDRDFVVTGSNDKIIRVFEISGNKPLLMLISHSDTVCSVQPGILPGTLLSASWDKTAAFWNIFDFKEPTVVLTGHEATVWAAVQMPTGIIVTASADKNIMIWELKGTLIDTLQGHTDCVRGLAVHSEAKVLSCSNDSCVKIWDLEEMSCLGTWYGHENYIYSVALFSYGENIFMSCGEDACLKLWDEDDCLQTINLPCQSAWCATSLPNGDIAVGLSDGTVRVFTQDEERMAPSEEREVFRSQVTSKLMSMKSKNALIDKNLLPGPEILATPGQQDGQTRLVREGDAVMCYKWSLEDEEWEKMGEVVGTGNGAGKELYCGQEYDYVFNIDVEDGKPPLKLPYNLGEDPWVIAQKFIHEHNLSQGYLDQVANFIIRNTQDRNVTTGMAAAAAAASDPFTGDGRYIPPPAGEPSTREHNHEDESHVAGDIDNVLTLSRDDENTGYFPQRTCIAFNVFNKTVIEDKLFLNNNLAGEHKLDIEHVDQVTMLLNERLLDETQMNALIKMMHWPEDCLVPALDLLRVAVRSKPVFQRLFSVRNGYDILTVIDKYMQPIYGSDVLRVLSLRTICNLMVHEEGRKLFLAQRDSILDVIKRYRKPYSKHMQMAVATVLLNLSVAANHDRDVATLTGVALTLGAVFPHIRESEASFRALVALGTCMWDFDGKDWDEPLLLVTTNAQIMEHIKHIAASSFGAPSSASDERHKLLEKLNACAEELLRKLQGTTKDN
ncbi:phospholipase A-2-activating protein [Schistocerca cancellata]|uniref:phospholipase A-2-activating protein n=1 Tax=Schistocerca cancellata TaxID=274614 RepID=UPI002117FFDA|nr:phospholipase A-2-activating protein [Schistocerca cancellata]